MAALTTTSLLTHVNSHDHKRKESEKRSQPGAMLLSPLDGYSKIVGFMYMHSISVHHLRKHLSVALC